MTNKAADMFLGLGCRRLTPEDAENGGGLAYDNLAVVPYRVPVGYQIRTCCALRTNVTGFDVPEHHGDGSISPVLAQNGNLSLEIWSSDGCRLKNSSTIKAAFERIPTSKVKRESPFVPVLLVVAILSTTLSPRPPPHASGRLWSVAASRST